MTLFPYPYAAASLLYVSVFCFWEAWYKHSQLTTHTHKYSQSCKGEHHCISQQRKVKYQKTKSYRQQWVSRLLESYGHENWS